MSNKGSTEEHQKLVDDLIFAFGSRPDVRCWIRVVGFDEAKKIAYGIPGEPDIEGIVAPYGRMLCIEVKSGNAVLSKKQKLRRDMLEKFGAIWILARSVEDALEQFEEKNKILTEYDQPFSL